MAQSETNSSGNRPVLNDYDTESLQTTNQLQNPVIHGAIQLTKENFDSTLALNELVLIAFYTEWCAFSADLKPVYDEAADILAKEFSEPGKVVLGRVDCDKESELTEGYNIFAYPVIKLIINGQRGCREFPGRRTTDDIVSFIRKEMEDPVKELFHMNELDELHLDQKIIIGHFDRKDQPEYNTFRKVAMNLKSFCQFYACFGERQAMLHPSKNPVVMFCPNKNSVDEEETFTQDLQNFGQLHTWVFEKCVPLIRELTHENDNELRDGGRPVLMLFHAPDDKQSIEQFSQVVLNELHDQKRNISVVTANHKKFGYCIYFLNKRESDLPIIAIKNLKGTHFFPNYKDIEVSGKLKQFVQDFLFSENK